MLFCPRCSNLLLIGSKSDIRFVCQTCCYFMPVNKLMYTILPLERKKVAEAEGEKNWEKIDSTAKCPKCGQLKAYYFELQTRSADEPMTIFYKCFDSSCAHQWKE